MLCGLFVYQQETWWETTKPKIGFGPMCSSLIQYSVLVPKSVVWWTWRDDNPYFQVRAGRASYTATRAQRPHISGFIKWNVEHNLWCHASNSFHTDTRNHWRDGTCQTNVSNFEFKEAVMAVHVFEINMHYSYGTQMCYKISLIAVMGRPWLLLYVVTGFDQVVQI